MTNSIKMKNLRFPLSIAVLMVLISCGKKNNNSKLVELSDQNCLKTITSANGGIFKIASKQANSIEFYSDGSSPISTIVFHNQKNNWHLSKYEFLAADITNNGKDDILVEIRPQENPWLGSGQIIAAGTTRTIKTPVIRDILPEYYTKKMFAMNAFSGGIIQMGAKIEPDSIKQFSIVWLNAPKQSTIYISNIRGEGSVKIPTESEFDKNYFPLVDDFFQLNKKDWPGKMHSLEELKKSSADEQNDLNAHVSLDDWDKFGGWLKGPRLKATGHFRTEKVDGKWWLVDPEGNLFWSHGIGTITLNQSTPVTDREHYFTQLPDSNKFRSFYSTRTNSPKGYYKGRSARSFNGYAWNMQKKYGDNWQSKFRDLAHKRLRSWGMNTIGGWSDPDVFNLRKTPYTETLSSNSRRIEGSEGQWYKFPDPFDNSLVKAIIDGVEKIKESANDPYCIGYFVDNEMNWGDNQYIAKAVIQSPSDQPAKQALMNYLKKKYKTISALNSTWKTNISSWNDILENRAIPTKIDEDLMAFSEVVANQYFSTIQQTLQQVAPAKLYLGCRFDFHYYPNEDTTGAWIVQIAGKYCDVVSFNRYRYAASDLIAGNVDKPIIIGEWHMGATDRGMLHFSLRYADDQKNRAEMYEYYIESCLKNPYIVGAHWFQYVDEPTLGRFDGENYNTGFLDVCDNPYPEMIEASRKAGNYIYKVRSK